MVKKPTKCYRPPGPRIVDHRRYVVGGQDQGPLVGQTPDGGVVARVHADQEVRTVHGCQSAYDVRQLAGGELAASTSAVAELSMQTSTLLEAAPPAIVPAALDRSIHTAPQRAAQFRVDPPLFVRL